MMTRTYKNRAQSINIPSSRWIAYAAAGAATALAGVNVAEADIHYSGRVDLKFRPDENKTQTFELGQPGAFMLFGHSFGYAFFEIEGLANEAFIGSSVFEYAFPYRVRGTGHYISEGQFAEFYNHGTLYNDRGSGRWGGEVTGFVGFRFDNGAGPQYGWARVKMLGQDAAFSLLDYAFGDPGEPVKPGQISSDGKSAPHEGSLGFIALGAAGLTLWRRRRRLHVSNKE